jgi:recombination protein RecT
MAETAIEKKAPTKLQTLAQAIANRQASFAAVATKYLPAERLVKLAQAALSRQPLLAECTTVSVLEQLMACARLGLEPNEPGGVWLVPFKNKNGTMECQKIIDYRGLIDVARRSGQIAAVHADVRRENDEWEFWIQTDSPTLVHLRHVPAESDRGEIVGVYAVAKLQNGQCHATYLTAAEVETYRARSRAKDAPTWKNDWIAMGCKTACRRMVNLLPKSAEIQVLREELVSEEDDKPVVDITAELTSRTDGIKAKLAAKAAENAPAQGTATDVEGLDAEAEQQEQEEPGAEG